jgi:large subunit ribosomal protein L25
MSFSIECHPRPEGKNPRALRREGLIPANLYGHNGSESVCFAVSAKDAVVLLKSIKVNETPVEVKIPFLSWTGTAIVREVQSHPWKRTLNHLSFFAMTA